MSLLTIIWSMLSAAGLVVGLVLLLVWLHDRGQKAHLAAAIMAVAAGAQALGELTIMKAQSLDGLPGLFVAGNYVIAVVLVSMVWFVHFHLGTARRPFLWLITGLWALCAMINTFSPFSLTYAGLTGLETGDTFWGESFAMPVGPTNPLKWIPDLTSILIVVFVADASVRAWRAGYRRRGLVVGGSILGFIVAAGIHTPLVDAGIVKTPFMIGVAFLGIVFALSYMLARDVARTLTFARELEAGQRRWNSLLRDVNLAVVDFGPDGLLRYANPFFCRIMGWSLEDLRGRRLDSLMIPSQRAEAAERLAKATGEGTLRRSARWTLGDTDQEGRTFDWSPVKLLTPEGHFDGILAVGADMTAQLEAEAATDQARMELDRVMRSNLLGEFVTALAHELNQPLAAILANARSLERYLDGVAPRLEEAREVTALIVRDDKRAATVLQRLRTMMTRGEIVREVVELPETIEETLEICRPEMRAAGIRLDLEMDPGLPRVKAGRVEIQQVMLNLLRNAVRALEDSRADEPAILIAGAARKGFVEVRVEDNGPGMTEEIQEVAFAPFNGQGDRGLGMGLAICRRIVEAHGGTIEARPRDRGTCLSFTLPAHTEEKARAAEV